MIKHVTSNSVIWADIPERFEAGTPSIINIITLAKAIQLAEKYGKIISENNATNVLSPAEILYQDKVLEYSGKKLLLKLKNLLIGKNIIVPTIEGLRPFINLDNAASTPTFFPIWDTFCNVLKQPGKISQEIIKEVRKICSNFLNAPLEKYDILFTSNTTEAINLVALSLTRSLREKDEPVIINTVLEHHSNELPFRYIPNSSMIRIQIDDDGFIDLNELETILKE